MIPPSRVGHFKGLSAERETFHDAAKPYLFVLGGGKCLFPNGKEVNHN